MERERCRAGASGVYSRTHDSVAPWTWLSPSSGHPASGLTFIPEHTCTYSQGGVLACPQKACVKSWTSVIRHLPASCTPLFGWPPTQHRPQSVHRDVSDCVQPKGDPQLGCSPAHLTCRGLWSGRVFFLRWAEEREAPERRKAPEKSQPWHGRPGRPQPCVLHPCPPGGAREPPLASRACCSRLGILECRFFFFFLNKFKHFVFVPAKRLASSLLVS